MLDLENLTGLILAFARMSGFIYFNPILGRRNFPSIVKTGTVLVLTYFLYSFNGLAAPEVSGMARYIVLIMAELGVGFVMGFLVNLFSSVIVLGGEFIDSQMGLSMSKIYDPQSNISMSLTATLYNILFIFLFLSTDGHLAMIELAMTSLEVVPLGGVVFTQELATGIIQIFSQTILLGVKLAMPIVAVEFLLEMAVGLVMKIIPQINIFVLNIQLKVTVGLICLFAFYRPTVSLLERIISMIFGSLEAAIKLMSGG